MGNFIQYSEIEDNIEFSSIEKDILKKINDKVLSGESLKDILKFYFDETQKIMPCDRIGIAFSEDGKRLTLYHVITSYSPVYLNVGYSADLKGSSLEIIFQNKKPRIINDLEKYYENHPDSVSTSLLIKEGVKSSMTCPLYVEDRIIGVMFRSSRKKNAYSNHELSLHAAIIQRLSQAIEKAFRIEQLTEAINAYMEMLSFVTHELKSPLSSIMTLANTAIKGYFGDISQNCKNTFEKINKQAEYLMNLINEYLNLAKLETKSITANKTRCFFEKDIIEPIIDLLQPQIEQMNIQVVKNYENIELECDIDLMKIVMHNLISNAIKYNYENGQIKITVKRDNDVAKISVFNTGPGFPENKKYKLFKRFSRIDTEELMKKKGSGIGLFIAWNIVYLHDGKITADSKYGEYAEFIVELPIN